MKELVAILPGIVGTVWMSLFIVILSAVIQKPLRVVGILGTMLTFRTTKRGGIVKDSKTMGIGILCHYTIGIFFSCAYLWLLKKSGVLISLEYTLYLSVLFGFFAVVIWKLFIDWHPNPPRLPLHLYFISIFFGHVVFCLGMYSTLTLLASFYETPISQLYMEAPIDQELIVRY